MWVLCFFKYEIVQLLEHIQYHYHLIYLKTETGKIPFRDRTEEWFINTCNWSTLYFHLFFVFRLRLEEFGRAFASIPAETDRRPIAVDLLWSVFQGPIFHAWLELVVASRTDKNLREALRAMNERFQDDLRIYFKEIFGPSPLTTDFELIPAFIFTLMDGMAMRLIVGNDVENEHILNLLKRYATLFLADRRADQSMN